MCDDDFADLLIKFVIACLQATIYDYYNLCDGQGNL